MKRTLVVFTAGLTASLLALCYVFPTAALFAAAAELGLTIAYVCLRGSRKRSAALAFSLGFAAGCLLWELYGVYVVSPVTAFAGKEGVCEAVVCEYSEQREDYASAIVLVERMNYRETSFRVKLYIDGQTALVPGDRLIFNAGFYVPQKRWYFDNERYLKTKRVYLSASADKVFIIDGEKPWWVYPRLAAGTLSAKLRELVPEENAALLSALIMGDDSGLGEDYLAALRSTGLSHIIAVSGMNVAFLTAILLLLFGRRLGGLLTIPAVLFFMLMTGMTASVVRAGLMQILAVLAYNLNRENDAKTSLSAALGLMLIVNPFAVGDIGLWLSYLSTLGLLTLSEPFTARLGGWLTRKKLKFAFVLRFIAYTAAATAAAQLFVLPVQVLTFGELSLVALPANIVCLWAAELAFFAGIAAAAAAFIWPWLGGLVAWLARMLTDYLLAVVPRLAGLPLASVRINKAYILPAILFILAILLISFAVLKKGRTTAALCAAAVFTLALLASGAERAEVYKLAVLAGFNGQSLVVSCGDYCAAVNCPSDSSLESYLEDEGLSSVSMLILTDYRSASAGGAAALLENYSVGRLLLPPGDCEAAQTLRAVAAELSVPVETLTGGEFYENGVLFKPYINPVDETELMLYINAEDYGVFIPGCVEPEELGLLLRDSPPGVIDCVAAGEFYSSRLLPGALRRFEPELAVFSSYARLPGDYARRLTAEGIEVVETERYGRLVIRQPVTEEK